MTDGTLRTIGIIFIGFLIGYVINQLRDGK